ncbi:GNAT family N-acetyltransferase [Falsirhodobacter halotolerans]|uniref:GNAT family N-acetyltransferase n=1 Tax=Falsirhodobacter halotolerans TaxID=1146892 RepID=UPI001FD1801B|nr:GNAT family N-acetyltransferase [Falsirhodobacter halotolerans]MCJ8139737.1 GNAT family N-acetyltransferase [Falsirhodobacter halotolerans]
MRRLTRGRFTLRTAKSEGDMARALELRTRAFGLAAPDGDAFDARCTHVLVEDGGDLVACYRLLPLTPDRVEESYAAQFYDLTGLRGFPGPMVEMGRFCIAPDRHDPDILRMAWGGVAAFVEGTGAQMLFGCSSFRGVAPAPYADAFALLRQAHLAPQQWQPGVRAAQTYPYAEDARAPDLRAAMTTMPPLLRSYLLMGGWVSDHAVIDAHMNTLHVFTGLEISAIPPGRARLLRALSG